MIPSPKERFLANPTLKHALGNIVANPDFHAALEAAQLAYAEQCSREDGADAGYWKSRGAFEFVKVLCNLHNPPVERVHKDLDNLPH